MKMIKTGIDIVLNKRFEKFMENSEFLQKVFHASELKDKSKLQSIFALKEAVMKALGKKLDWKNIQIIYEKSGRPKIILSDNVKPSTFKNIDCSISHDGDYTIAIAVIELEQKNNKQPQ